VSKKTNKQQGFSTYPLKYSTQVISVNFTKVKREINETFDDTVVDTQLQKKCKLVNASTDYCHHAGKTTPCGKATCLASQSITATTTKFHPSWEISPQRKRQRTNSGPLPPLKIQDKEAIHVSGLSVNDVPPTANMAVHIESVNPPLPPLSPNHSEMEAIESVVNPCAEAWTNASRYRATVEDADSDEESEGDEGGMPSSKSEDGDSSLSDSDISDDGLGIEDSINDEFERELGNFGAYLNVSSPSRF
jgi:hypothetical protein